MGTLDSYLCVLITNFWMMNGSKIAETVAGETHFYGQYGYHWSMEKI